MYALLAQYKDAMGTIFIIKMWTTASGKFEMKVMSKVQTLNRTFTTFVSLVLPANGVEFVEDHIAIVTPDSDRPNFPRVSVLNLTADQVEKQEVLSDILPNQSDVKMDAEIGKAYQAFGEKGKNSEQENREGNISCIAIRNKRLKPSMDAIMAQINSGIKGDPEPEYE